MQHYRWYHRQTVNLHKNRYWSSGLLISGLQSYSNFILHFCSQKFLKWTQSILNLNPPINPVIYQQQPPRTARSWALISIPASCSPTKAQAVRHLPMPMSRTTLNALQTGFKILFWVVCVYRGTVVPESMQGHGQTNRGKHIYLVYQINSKMYWPRKYDFSSLKVTFGSKTMKPYQQN